MKIYKYLPDGKDQILYIYGEGRISNGVAAKYFFWIRRNLGGFEYFEMTTSYQRLEKVKI